MCPDQDELIIERAGVDLVEEALPLLVVQMREHGIEPDAMGPGRFATAVRELVAKEHGVMLVARRSDVVIGVAVLAHTWTIDRGGFCTWLDELYVLPEERDRGVGTALLRRAMDVARSLGCRAIDLEVDFDHARVEGLYLREGFTAFRRRHFTLSLLAEATEEG